MDNDCEKTEKILLLPYIFKDLFESSKYYPYLCSVIKDDAYE